MRVSWAKVALGTVLALAVVAPVTSAVAQQQGTDPLRVTIHLKGADLVMATQELMKQTGLSMIVDGSGQPFNQVTCDLVDIPAEDAISYMCQAAGAYFRRDENGVYVISHNKPDATQTNPTADPPAPKHKERARVKLMHADPEEVCSQILFGVPLDPSAKFANLNRFRRVANGDQSTLGYYGDKTNYEPRSMPSVNAVAQPSVGQVTTNPNETGNGVQLPGEKAGQMGVGGGGGGLGGGFGGGGQGGFGGGGQGGFGGGFGGGGQGGFGGQGGQNVTLQGGQGLVPSGISFISYDPTDNSFIVEGDDQSIQDFIKLINDFDVAPKQVSIKVEFITTSSSLTKDLGFEFLYARGGVFAGETPGTFVQASDPIFLNYGTGNVTSRMRTQLLEGFGKVVDAPIVRTLNNQPAQVFTSDQTTIFINVVSTNGAGSVIVTPEPVSLTISTGLIVAPRINNDGTITMSLSPQIQDFGQLQRGPDGEEIPDVLSEAINLVARVKNDETIVLGGLTRKSDQGSESRVPILADLPIIGQFFRSTTRDKNNSELLIFVTPHIIEEEEGTGGG